MVSDVECMREKERKKENSRGREIKSLRLITGQLLYGLMINYRSMQLFAEHSH